MEWGPRALGNRSILAHPQDPAVRDRINLMIKNEKISDHLRQLYSKNM